MKILRNNQLTIKVAAQGAELISIINNHTGTEYIWQADPAFWQRHSPILFPIVGSVWENHFTIDGISYTMAQHGFARDMNFELFIDSPDEVCYLLESTDETLSRFPFSFQLKIAYKLVRNKVTVIWEVKNTGLRSIPFQIGAHPAFNYFDFDPSDEIHGYFRLNSNFPLSYRLIKEKGCIDPERDYILTLNTEQLLPLTADTFNRDALIFENKQIHRVDLLDKQKQNYLTLHTDAPVMGLWSPVKRNAPFVCIEPWYGRCDRVGYKDEFRNRDWVNILAPDQKFMVSYTIEAII